MVEKRRLRWVKKIINSALRIPRQFWLFRIRNINFTRMQNSYSGIVNNINNNGGDFE